MNLVVRAFGIIYFFLLVASCATGPLRPAYQVGTASWYGKNFQGRPTASGEKFDRFKLTAAHPQLPFGTWVLVRSQSTGQTVKVRINDRGPFSSQRIIDLSQAAAERLGMIEKGHDTVELFLDQ